MNRVESHCLTMPKDCFQTACGCLLLILLAGCATLGGNARRALAGSFKTDHLEIRYRPGSKTAAEAETVGLAAERELGRMCRLFEVANDQTFTLFIFDDQVELHAVTKISDDLHGFATGHEGYFVLHDPALVHEMGHLVAYAKIGRPADDFLNEAMAEAVFDATKTATMDAEAKYLLSHQQLPALRELRGLKSLPEWMKSHPRISLYQVGGSWLRFLLRSYGAEKTKRFYREANTEKIFGASLENLEASWHLWLENARFRPEAMAALDKLHVWEDGHRTIMAGKVFTFTMVVPESERAGATFHWEKDGQPRPDLDPFLL